MAKLKILKDGDTALRLKSRPVSDINNRILTLLIDLCHLAEYTVNGLTMELQNLLGMGKGRIDQSICHKTFLQHQGNQQSRWFQSQIWYIHVP